METIMYPRLAVAGVGILLVTACGENAFAPSVDPQAERVAPPHSGSHLTQQFLITPVALDFGQVAVGETSPEQFVVVTNVAHGAVEMSGSAADAGVFGSVQNCDGNVLGEGDSCVMAYNFTPTAAGSVEAVAMGEWNGQPFSIALRGVGVAGDRFAVSGVGLDFGQVPVGGAAAEQVVTLTNRGPGSIVLSGSISVVGSDFAASDDCGGATLAEGASCAMSFSFAPSGAGEVSGSADVAWNGQSWSIALRGEGMQHPSLAIARTAFDFGEVTVGGFSALEVVNVTNVGPAPVLMSGTGGVANLFGTMESCQNVMLAAGSSCQMYFYFMPSEVGVATETVTGTWNGVPYSIALRGEAIAEEAQRTRRFLIGTRGLDFGPVDVGSSSPTLDITVTNLGPGSVVMDGTASIPAGFTGSQTCQGATLPAGQSCQMSYRFTPGAAGETSAVATGTWNGESYSIALRGFGLQQQRFLITPTAHDFGSVQIGASSPAHVIRVTNLGPGSVVMSGAGFAADGFDVVDLCTGATLAEGASCELRYSFTPTAAGEVSGTADGSWNGQPYSFTFRGVGVQSDRFLISPTGLDFGEVEVGTTAPAQSVRITNLGPGPIAMDGTGGTATLFSSTGDCHGATLDEGDTCSMTYGFAPLVPGLVDEVVTGSWNGQSFSVGLRARGVEPLDPAVRFGQFLAPLDRRLKVQPGATLPVRVRLLDGDGATLSDAEGAAMAQACAVVITFSELPDRPLCGRYVPGQRSFHVNLQIPRLIRAGMHHITVDVRIGEAVVAAGRAEIEVRGR
jgi:hypothetical protein